MRRPLMFAAAALVLLVVVVARGESPVPSNLRDAPDYRFPGMGGGENAERTNGVRPTSGAGGGTLTYVIIASLIVLLVVVAVGLAIRVALRRRHLVRTGVPEQGAATALPVPGVAFEQAVVRARELLGRPGGRPGDAVIEAWLALEHATQGRRPHETATEFTAALPADEQALAELRGLYQRARFSTVPTTADDVARARDALDRILVTL